MSTVRAKIDGFVGWSGGEVRLHFNEEYDDNHPLVQERPDLFTQPIQPEKRSTSSSKASGKGA